MGILKFYERNGSLNEKDVFQKIEKDIFKNEESESKNSGFGMTVAVINGKDSIDIQAIHSIQNLEDFQCVINGDETIIISVPDNRDFAYWDGHINKIVPVIPIVEDNEKSIMFVLPSDVKGTVTIPIDTNVFKEHGQTSITHTVEFANADMIQETTKNYLDASDIQNIIPTNPIDFKTIELLHKKYRNMDHIPTLDTFSDPQIPYDSLQKLKIKHEIECYKNKCQEKSVEDNNELEEDEIER